jgi:cyclopropane fatty-acyl-phospholipid synthase-like methyltransferase
MTSPKVRTPLERRQGALWAAAWQRIPGAITRTLSAGGSALEVGCGSGLACLALAEAVPEARVVGHDADPAAIARARELARAAGVQDRVHFALDDSTRLPRAAYQLITAEALRTRSSEPRRVLNAIRNALVPDGVCLLLDESLTALGSSAREPLDLPALVRQVGFSRVRLLASDGPLPLYELRR